MPSKRNSLPPCKKCGNTSRDQRGGICGKCAFPHGVPGVTKRAAANVAALRDELRAALCSARGHKKTAMNDEYAGVPLRKEPCPHGKWRWCRHCPNSPVDHAKTAALPLLGPALAAGGRLLAGAGARSVLGAGARSFATEKALGVGMNALSRSRKPSATAFAAPQSPAAAPQPFNATVI